MIRERQAEGIAIAKQIPGKYPGRKRRLSAEQAREAREHVAAGIPKAHIARQLGISRNTLYAYLSDDRRLEGAPVER